ncbi:ankyrin repeat domain-containing protein 33B [Entelurus aequoreus]|uniref:ankyrin repeat domain-containing protein 33B n=1 Tax=Entelurus aequoreus TaxID=161455 RepID=UPI002B1E3A25|nr:ankyrin repeat domain-containing protein 33B [Entelurus aequoreus]
MVLITEEGSGKLQENGVAGRMGPVGVQPGPNKEVRPTPVMSVTEVDKDGDHSEESGENEEVEADYTRNYWEDEDDIYQEFEELDFEALSEDSDTRSIASDDSFYPIDSSVGSDGLRSPSPESPEPITFFKACCNNNAIIVKIMIRQGVTEEEVQETDRNRRSALIVACYHGYVDVVIALAQCPYIDVNWQDNEGNTALITAAQAGHVIISYFLLNYFSGLDIERRNCHGFTALMKAAMQGRADCCRMIMLAGGDVQARDGGRKMTPREWALFTGRYETANLMYRLMMKPCAEQFCDCFSLEWPLLEDLVSQAQEPKSCCKRLVGLLSCCPFRFYLSNKVNPLDDGVLEHMVRITTGLSSPVVATACRTVCPGSPPCLGKRRYAVQDILRKQRLADLKNLGPERLNHYKTFFQNSRVLLIPKARDRRASLQPQILTDMAAAASSVAMRRASLLPLHLLRRSSVRPGIVVPKVRLCKAPAPSFIPEKLRRTQNYQQLQIPKWNYKMKKVERKREERQRLLPMTRRR